MFVCRYNVTFEKHSSPHQASVPSSISTQHEYDPEAEADCISQDSSSAWSARDPSLSRVMLWHCSRVTQSWLRSCLGTRMRPSPHNPQIRTKLKCFLRHWEKRGFWGSREHLHTMHHWHSDALLASRFPVVHWCFHFIVQDYFSFFKQT